MKKRQDQFIRDCVEWDVTNWSKAFAFWKANAKLENSNYECMELGGRSGGLSLWLSMLGNNVICSDLENPEKNARKLHDKYDLPNPIRYQAVDATNIPFEKHFDIIVFKSILGGISRNNNSHLNQIVINQIYKALKPGGKLLFAENLEATSLHRFVRRKFTNWGRYWNYLTVTDMRILFKGFQDLKHDTAGFLAAFGRTEKQRNFLGKLDTLLFDKTVSRQYEIYCLWRCHQRH